MGGFPTPLATTGGTPARQWLDLSKVAFERRETQRVLDFVGFRLTQPNLQLYASLKRLSTQLGAIAPTVRKIDRASPPSNL
jgi:hypothetical protein